MYKRAQCSTLHLTVQYRLVSTWDAITVALQRYAMRR